MCVVCLCLCMYVCVCVCVCVRWVGGVSRTWNPEMSHPPYAWELQSAGLWPWFPWQWAAFFGSLLLSGPADGHRAKGFGLETEDGRAAPSDPL